MKPIKLYRTSGCGCESYLSKVEQWSHTGDDCIHRNMAHYSLHIKVENMCDNGVPEYIVKGCRVCVHSELGWMKAELLLHHLFKEQL